MSAWIDALPEAIEAASKRIAPHVLTTPVTAVSWAEGLDLRLKCEHLQHTGSFKLRGALIELNSKYERRPPLDPELKRELRERFRPELERLGALVGRDLSGWSADPA